MFEVVMKRRHGTETQGRSGVLERSNIARSGVNGSKMGKRESLEVR